MTSTLCKYQLGKLNCVFLKRKQTCSHKLHQISKLKRMVWKAKRWKANKEFNEELMRYKKEEEEEVEEGVHFS